jgi:hypothetical protein
MVLSIQQKAGPFDQMEWRFGLMVYHWDLPQRVV